MPSNEFRPGKRAEEERVRPLNSFLQRGCDGAERMRHAVGHHRDRRISIDDWLIHDLCPAIQTDLLDLVLAVHLIEQDVSVLAGGSENGIYTVGVCVQLIQS